MAQYLLNIPNYHLTVATRTPDKAYALVGDNPRGLPIPLDMEKEPARFDKLVDECDLAISLLPPMFHPVVAEACIKHRKNMVTTSYVSPKMKELDKQAKAANIIILNEIGLDPGIDHMSAMRIIDGVRNAGGKVTSFRSYCGGLPAPEANTNPYGYKFSWSPRGVVLAARNSAKYLEDGKLVEIPGEELFGTFHKVKLEELPMALEAYPNRDSLIYMDLYGLQDVKTMYRGTLRYEGHCVTWKKLADIGYFNIDVIEDLGGLSYRAFTARLAGVPNDGNLEKAIVKKYSLPTSPDVLGKWQWLGLLDDKKPLPSDTGSPLDFLVAVFLEKLQYARGERDMVVLHHKFEAEYPGRKEAITSTLVDYGIPNGDTSMARTVSLPAAVAVKMILEGKINLKGVQIPVMPEVYNPVLNELETLGIKCVERTMALQPN
jgi:saccharopine dehydrogenase-like NADP-dependent oxidoreductase